MTAEKGIIRGRISPAHSRVVLVSTPLPFPSVPAEEAHYSGLRMRRKGIFTYIRFMGLNLVRGLRWIKDF